MKKLILITTGVVLFSAASFAQTDSTKRDQTQTQTPTTQQQPTQSDQMRADEKDLAGWTRVQSTDVPTSLRTTLGDEKYKGWETGTVYMNAEGNSYAYRSSGQNGQIHYFDKNGKSIKKPNNK